MKSFFAFLILPFSILLALSISPWLGQFIVSPPEAVSIQQLTLPPGLRDIAPDTDQGGRSSAIRLEALMPAAMIDLTKPLAPVEHKKAAVERFRLASVLITPTSSSAVIDGELLFEGSRFAEYRVAKIRQDSVALSGPRGTELLRLDAAQVDSLFPVARTERDRVRVLIPTRKTEISKSTLQLPPEELERQFRHLLENFSH